MYDFLADGAGQVLGKGDAVDLPTQAKPTNRSATTRQAAQQLTPTVDTMNANEELFYNVELPPKSRIQLLNGGWVASMTPAMLAFMANDRDDNIIDHVITTVLASQNTENQVNVAANSLTATDLATAEGKLADVPGNNRANFMYIMSAFAYASVQQIGAFIPAQANAETGRLGIPMVTSINGIPAFLTGGGALKDVTLTTSSAITVATNVATATVPSGHSFSAGMLMKTVGATVDTPAAGVAITSVTDTTIVYPLTTGDGALADGVADFLAASSMMLLFDRTKIYKASQLLPRVKIEGDFESGMEALQVLTYYARQAVGGTANPAAIVLHAPRASA